MSYQDRTCLAGKNLGSAVVEELLQCLALRCHLGHVLTHPRASLHTGIAWRLSLFIIPVHSSSVMS